MADKYYRLVYLIITICSDALRNFFLTLAKSDLSRNFITLQTYLGQRQAEIDKLKRSRKLHNYQYNLLFPPGGPPDINNWDVTLLVTLITNLFKLQPLEETALNEVRDVRNELQHISHTQNISNEEFENSWGRLDIAVKLIAKNASGQEYETQIEDRIRTALVRNMPDLGDVLRAFYEENQKQMMETINRLEEEMSSQKAKITELQTKIDTMEKHTAESTSILRSTVVTNVGYKGEKVKRFKTVDQILSRLKAKFRETMSELPNDYTPICGLSEITSKLQDHHYVVVSGSCNSRYLETALYVIRALQYDVGRCVEMCEAEEWHHIDPEDVDLVLCRSPFGNDAYDGEKASRMFVKFDSILHAVKPRNNEKHIDFVIVTDCESLTEFQTRKEHELLEAPVKLFPPTTPSEPEDLTGAELCCQSAVVQPRRELSRQMTDIFLSKYSNRDNSFDRNCVMSAKKKLKEKKFLLISGPEKSGNSTLAAILAASYKTEAVLLLHFPSDIKQLDLEKTSLVIIDEFVGIYGFDKVKVHEWLVTLDILEEAVDAGKLNVIITCEEENLKRCLKEFKSHRLLSDPEVLSFRWTAVKQELVGLNDYRRQDLAMQGHNKVSGDLARSVLSISEYNVGLPDERTCLITGCCVLPDGRILLLDTFNKRLKKLDAGYRMTSVCDLPECLNCHDVYYVGNNVAVVGASPKLIYVDISDSIVVLKTATLDDEWLCITGHEDRLYVLSQDCLNTLSLDGTIVTTVKFYKSLIDDCWTSIEVADDGNRLYISNEEGLFVLRSFGDICNTLSKEQLSGARPCGMCIDDRDNIWLTCENGVLYQVSASATRILQKISEGVRSDRPVVVCYNKHRSSLIMGDFSHTIYAVELTE